MEDFNVDEFFNLLEGTWTGSGKGLFPTIPPFEYKEVLKFQRDEERPLVHYEQRTWIEAVLGQTRRASHWETGFLRFDNQMQGTMHSAQNSGRAEFLRLDGLRAAHGKYELSFTTSTIFKDERIVGSKRKWLFDRATGSMHYEMHMATSIVNDIQLHLSASLQKQS